MKDGEMFHEISLLLPLNMLFATSKENLYEQ